MNCPNCGGDNKHLERITNIKNGMPNDTTIQAVSEFYKVMGDPTRIKLLSALENGPLCVSDLSCCLNMSLSAVSHQLKLLRVSNLVKSKKVGKVVFYELDDEHVKEILDLGIEHTKEKI